MRTYMTVVAIAALAGAAQAGSVVRLDNLNGYGSMVSDFETAFSVNGSLNRHLGLPGPADWDATSAGFTFDTLANAVGNPLANGFNGSFAVSIGLGAANTGDFYYGDTDQLRDIDFDGGDEGRPSAADNSLAIAFGNEEWTSNEIQIDLAPGVTSFGFNYEDIGDVGGTLKVQFSTGAFSLITITPGDGNAARDGFIYAIAGIGEYIDSISFLQDGGTPNDGFIFYGFSSVQAIPLPPAAFAGLGLLGAMGVVRRLRNR